MNKPEFDLDNFQTPPEICDYMVSLIRKTSTPKAINTVLEPTPGKGNLVRAIEKEGYKTFAPKGMFSIEEAEKARGVNGLYWSCVMNPPFSPMKQGYEILGQCMQSHYISEIIALMPWLVLINSSKRTTALFDYGLKSVTQLPRRIFHGSRVQTCILHLSKYYSENTIFMDYDKVKSGTKSNSNLLPKP